MIRLILLAAILSSCSGAWHLQQAIKKGVVITRDTVHIEKQVIVPGDSTKIFVPVTKLKDSLVTVYRDRIKIQYMLRRDTIRFNVECPPDTVLVKVPVAVNTEIECPPKSPFWRNLALALIVVLAVVLLFKR